PQDVLGPDLVLVGRGGGGGGRGRGGRRGRGLGGPDAAGGRGRAHLRNALEPLRLPGRAGGEDLDVTLVDGVGDALGGRAAAGASVASMRGDRSAMKQATGAWLMRTLAGAARSNAANSVIARDDSS